MTVIDYAVTGSSGAHLLALFADFCELNPFLVCSIRGTGICEETTALTPSLDISEVESIQYISPT